MCWKQRELQGQRPRNERQHGLFRALPVTQKVGTRGEGSKEAGGSVRERSSGTCWSGCRLWTCPEDVLNKEAALSDLTHIEISDHTLQNVEAGRPSGKLLN